MQITETLSDGLKREFKIVVPADDLKRKVDGRLEELSKTVHLPGFRPGKVPRTLLQKKYGPAVMGEVLERAVSDASSQAITERGLRPAVTPKVDIKTFSEGADLEYTLAFELLPDVKPMDLGGLEIERVKAAPGDGEVQTALERLAESRRETKPLAEDRPAQKGDVLVIDFEGTVEGKALPGMAAKDHHLELGSNQFVPTFEDQLVGHSRNENVALKVTFPKEYVNDQLAGKEAEFKVLIKEIREKLPVAVDEALAQSMGFDDLETLRKAIRDQLGRDYGRVARNRLKRQVLDRLAAGHDFPVPQGMVDIEFNAIWSTIEEERKRGLVDPGLTGKSDDEIKAEFRAIAERRVRLGLLLSEIGRLNNIQVSQEEVNRALSDEARRFPGQERRVVEYYRQNPEALARLRAPIFEDKVVDFIIEMAKVTEREVPPEELLKEPEETAPAAAG